MDLQHTRLVESAASTAEINPKGADEIHVAPPSSPDLGQIGAYRLLKLLGAGGMGQVFLALHTRLEKVVALKVLPKAQLSSRESIARFQREMLAVGRLNHPHIVRALDAGEADGAHYLAMEYVQGVDLSQLAKKCGPLPVADACELARQAASGLQAAHEVGMVHRDIKPSNLMLCRPARRDAVPVVKVLDLGLALLSGGAAAERGTLTTRGCVVGTIDYMAPEQGGDSHLVDIRCDIYSLGATLYKLLSSHAPYADPKYDTAIKKLMALATTPPKPILDRRPDVPARLAQVIGRMLARNRDDRFATPDEAADAIAPFCAGNNLSRLLESALGEGAPQSSYEATQEPAPAVDPRQGALEVPKKSSRRRFAIVGGITLGGLFVALPFVFRPEKPSPSPSVPQEPAAADGERAGDPTPVTGTDDGKPAGAKVPADDERVDLLADVSLVEDIISGNWEREGTALVSLDGLNYPRFRSRHLPPEQYELTAVVERISGNDAIEFGLVIAERPVRLILDGFNPRLCGLELIDGRESNANETTFRETVLTNGQPSSVQVTVRLRSIRVVVDDHRIIDWEGDPARFSAASYYALADPQPLWIGTPYMPVRIHSWKLRSIDD